MTKKRLLILNIFLLFAVSGLAVAIVMMPLTIKVQYNSLTGTRTVSYTTNTRDIDAFREELTEEISDPDLIIDAEEDSSLTNLMTLEVREATVREGKVAGKKQELKLYPGTIQENLDINNIDYDSDDIISPALDESVTEDTEIKVDEVHYETVEETKKVAQGEEVVFDPSISSGTIQTVEGKPGKGIYRYDRTYINGKLKDETETFVKWKKKPVKDQIRFGTSATGETGTVSYSRTFTGNCTAYYMGKNPRGATGQTCHYGTCAVDPTVIPYGTKLYVEGYGTAVANDCGGAVKGNVIDLYMTSTKQAIRWGRRYMTVYVLE